jgi:hypothetical protein
MYRVPHRSLAGTCLAVVLTLVAGCGDGASKPVPVTGSVTVRKQPADGALVRLWPVEKGGPEAVRPMGYVLPDGTFRLTSETENDGAPPGRYKVTVEWRPKKKSSMEADGPDRLNGRYADPKTSKIEVTVNATETRLDPITLE